MADARDRALVALVEMLVIDADKVRCPECHSGPGIKCAVLLRSGQPPFTHPARTSAAADAVRLHLKTLLDL